MKIKKNELDKIMKHEVRKVIQEQLFNIPGVKWGQSRGRTDRRGPAGGDLEGMESDIRALDPASDLSGGQRKAYNASVAAASQDAKEQIDSLRDELTSKFRNAIEVAIEDVLSRVIDPEIADMREQYSETFELIFKEIQREFLKAQEELNKRMENVASQYLMKRDAPRVVANALNKMQGKRF